MEENEKSKAVFHSLIKKYFPSELLVKLELVTQTHGIDNNSKTTKILELLNEYNIPYSSLGNGTNRYGFLVDGYAVKIALDRAGHIDNKREFKYAKTHYPDVVKVYECTVDGLLAVFEYITIFSMDDFVSYQEDMRKILKKITENYLVGDVGISTINYINWGIRADGSIAILDFAYIYSLSYRGFLCTCEDEGILQYDKDFNFLRCPFCGKKWSFSDIRKRITKEDELNEIGDIREVGYNLKNSEEELIVDYEKSPHMKPKVKKEKIKPVKKSKEIIDINYINDINNMVDGNI